MKKIVVWYLIYKHHRIDIRLLSPLFVSSSILLGYIYSMLPIKGNTTNKIRTSFQMLIVRKDGCYITRIVTYPILGHIYKLLEFISTIKRYKGWHLVNHSKCYVDQTSQWLILQLLTLNLMLDIFIYLFMLPIRQHLNKILI